MKEYYVVYKKNTANKLFESDNLELAAKFIDDINFEKKKHGDIEFDKFEIVKIIK